MKRRLSLAVALSFAAAMTATVPATAATSYSCQSNGFDGNLRVTGDCVINAGKTITGNVRVTNGTLTIYGTVRGTVRQTDTDGVGRHVIVSGSGRVGGSIIERGGGRLELRNVADVRGDLYEYDQGFLNVCNHKWNGTGFDVTPCGATVRGDVWSGPEPNGYPDKTYCNIYDPANVRGELRGACDPTPDDDDD